jgi:hypothetical protein
LTKKKRKEKTKLKNIINNKLEPTINYLVGRGCGDISNEMAGGVVRI